MGSGVTDRTFTGVAIHSIVTRATVDTGIRVAFVDLWKNKEGDVMSKVILLTFNFVTRKSFRL